MSKLPYPLDKGGTHWEGCHRTTHHHNCAVLRCDNHESTIADLREQHEAFVRAAKDDAIAAEGYLSLDGRMRNWAAFMAAQRIIALCDAELGKEGK